MSLFKQDLSEMCLYANVDVKPTSVKETPAVVLHSCISEYVSPQSNPML